MKDSISFATGLMAGMVSWLVGGLDTPILALMICMGVSSPPTSQNGGIQTVTDFRASP